MNSPAIMSLIAPALPPVFWLAAQPAARRSGKIKMVNRLKILRPNGKASGTHALRFPMLGKADVFSR